MRSTWRRGILPLAVVALLATVPAGRAYEQAVKLFPLAHISASGQDGEVVFGLVGWHGDAQDYDCRVFPVFWGDNYLHLFPLYWSADGNWLLVPLAWDWNGNRGVGPLWWSDSYIVFAPLFWRRGDEWVLLPLACNWGGLNAVGPVWWRSDGPVNVFPLYWRDESGWVLLPIAWQHGGSSGVGPVWWGSDYLTVFPLYWQRGGNWLLLPCAWNWDGVPQPPRKPKFLSVDGPAICLWGVTLPPWLFTAGYALGVRRV